MGKWLFLIVFLAAAYLLFKSTRGARSRPRQKSSKTESMVACDRCGIHLPRSEAVEQNGRYFCCKDHGVPETR